MTVYGFARVSVRETEHKSLDLQVEQLVRACCAMENVRAQEANGYQGWSKSLSLCPALS